LRRQPGHFWAQFGLATCYLRLQQWVAAKTVLTACLDRRPDFAWLYPLRALAHGELREFAAAEADFRTAEGLPLDDSTRYGLLVGRGVVRLRQEKYDEAEADLQAAVALRPDSYPARVDLAQVYQKQHKLDEAREQLDLAIRHEPTLASLYRERAQLHLRRDDPAAALKDLEKAIDIEPLGRKAADDHAGRGRIYQEDGHAPGGRAGLRRRPGAPPRPGLRLPLEGRGPDRAGGRRPGRSRALQQQIVRALDAFLRHGTPDAAVYRARGQALAKLGNYEGAVDDYTRALALEPDSATHAARGWTYQLALDASVPALRDFEAAIRLDARNGDAYNGRGLARVRLDLDVRDAVADAEQALRLGPEVSRTPYNAGPHLRAGRRPVRRPDGPRRPPPCPAGPVPGSRRAVAPPGRRRVPAAARRSFWRTIEADAALDPIRRCSGFLQLKLENSGAAQ
jgi:tetratricopeptide (TPR) repeat protein